MADTDKAYDKVSGRQGWVHPRRIVGAAFLAGTMLGASAMSAKHAQQKNTIEKLFDRFV